MFHEGGFSVSATIETLQFLILCAFCDGLVVKGDEMPILAWITPRGVQNLAQQDKSTILKWLISI